MKKFPIKMLALATVVLAGCSRELPVSPDRISMSFDVSVGSTAKASADGDGQGAYINRCILQIWKDTGIDRTIIQTARAGTKEFYFKDVLLDPEEIYDFLFWADCGTESGTDLYYSTSTLKNVCLPAEMTGNNDSLDAFCGRVLGCSAGSDFEYKLILTRPLAQLNLIAEDISSLTALPSYDLFKPVNLSFSYFGCRAYNVKENLGAGVPECINVKDVPLYGKTTMAMAYVFPQDGSALTSVRMIVKTANDGSVTQDFENIPLKSNYRTNVRGKLLTVKGDFSISVNPIFEEIN